jgi:hypothetical protein
MKAACSCIINKLQNHDRSLVLHGLALLRVLATTSIVRLATESRVAASAVIDGVTSELATALVPAVRAHLKLEVAIGMGVPSLVPVDS